MFTSGKDCLQHELLPKTNHKQRIRTYFSGLSADSLRLTVFLSKQSVVPLGQRRPGTVSVRSQQGSQWKRSNEPWRNSHRDTVSDQIFPIMLLFFKPLENLVPMYRCSGSPVSSLNIYYEAHKSWQKARVTSWATEMLSMSSASATLQEVCPSEGSLFANS